MTFVLDAYAARSCPLKTVNAFTPHLVAPSIERSDPPFFRDADAIEADVIARLCTGPGTIVDLRPTLAWTREEAQRACVDAMASGAALVIGGFLPSDPGSHRTGRPSLLVRGEDGYHPVHIKFHRVLEKSGAEETPVVVSRLDAPRHTIELPGRRFRWGTRLKAALQVAHYWRLLEAAGFAASDRWAGLIGIEQVNLAPDGTRAEMGPVITWLDLDDACVAPSTRNVEVPADAPRISTLARYDDEHAYRVRLAEAALSSSGQTTLLTPIVSPECRGCVWQPHCQAQLDADDLSLRISKAPLDVHEVRTLRRFGITTVGELAQADLEALLVDYLPRVSHRPGGEERLRRAHHRAQMMDAGVELERISDDPIDLPRHELEIDIDIETSADDRVYLWGFWVDDPAARPPRYREFSTFGPLDDASEAALAASALGWLRSVTTGRDAAVYHYSDYEVLRIGKLAPRLADEALAAWARDAVAARFVDLFSVVRDHYLGANGLGLKVVAAAVTGFAWRDEDPGGLNSQSWHADAVGHEDAGVRELARVRVLEYNEDDVRATWHLRRWLRDQD